METDCPSEGRMRTLEGSVKEFLIFSNNDVSLKSVLKLFMYNSNTYLESESQEAAPAGLCRGEPASSSRLQNSRLS